MTTARMLSPEQAAAELGVSRATGTLTPGSIVRRYGVTRDFAERSIRHLGRRPTAKEMTVWIRRNGMSDVPTGRVYFVEARGADRIKIGFTSASDPHERIQSLQTACPFPLVLLAHVPGSMGSEADLHTRFASERVMQNTEWFHATPDLRWYIEELRQ